MWHFVLSIPDEWNQGGDRGGNVLGGRFSTSWYTAIRAEIRDKATVVRREKKICWVAGFLLQGMQLRAQKFEIEPRW
jgi:hypothetical protein